MKKSDKFLNSIQDLEHSLTFIKRVEEDRIFYNGISKSFETCLEYAWKYLKAKVNDEGLEAHGPKDVIKRSGRLSLVDNVEFWLKCIEARNQAVHDYLGLDKNSYLKLIEQFFKEVSKI